MQCRLFTSHVVRGMDGICMVIVFLHRICKLSFHLACCSWHGRHTWKALHEAPHVIAQFRGYRFLTDNLQSLLPPHRLFVAWTAHWMALQSSTFVLCVLPSLQTTCKPSFHLTGCSWHGRHTGWLCKAPTRQPPHPGAAGQNCRGVR